VQDPVLIEFLGGVTKLLSDATNKAAKKIQIERFLCLVCEEQSAMKCAGLEHLCAAAQGGQNGSSAYVNRLEQKGNRVTRRNTCI